jgi:hypothetical protein
MKRCIITHPKPHNEERLAMFALTSGRWPSAEEHFPGISDATLVFWSELPKGTTREQWEKAGCIFIGCFGSEFDEHPTTDAPRKTGESAVSLVAKKLGIDKDPKFQRLLQWTTNRDLKLGSGPFEIPRIIKMMNDAGIDDNTVQKWAFTAFEVIYSQPEEYFGAIPSSAGRIWGQVIAQWMVSRLAKHFTAVARTRFYADNAGKKSSVVAKLLRLHENKALARILDFSDKRWEKPCGTAFEPHVLVAAMDRIAWPTEEMWNWVFPALDIIYERAQDFVAAEGDFNKAKIVPVTIDGRKINAVIGASDSLQFSKYARSDHGCNAGIVIMKNSNGNVMIETDNHLELNVGPVVELLRVAELRLKGLPVPTNTDLLRGEAALDNCPEWYAQLNAYRILNGSTTESRPPTAIKFENIVGLAFLGFRVEGFNAPTQRAIAPQPQQLISASAMASA